MGRRTTEKIRGGRRMMNLEEHMEVILCEIITRENMEEFVQRKIDEKEWREFVHSINNDFRFEVKALAVTFWLEREEGE